MPPGSLDKEYLFSLIESPLDLYRVEKAFSCRGVSSVPRTHIRLNNSTPESSAQLSRSLDAGKSPPQAHLGAGQAGESMADAEAHLPKSLDRTSLLLIRSRSTCLPLRPATAPSAPSHTHSLTHFPPSLPLPRSLSASLPPARRRREGRRLTPPPVYRQGPQAAGPGPGPGAVRHCQRLAPAPRAPPRTRKKARSAGLRGRSQDPSIREPPQPRPRRWRRGWSELQVAATAPSWAGAAAVRRAGSAASRAGPGPPLWTLSRPGPAEPAHCPALPVCCPFRLD